MLIFLTFILGAIQLHAQRFRASLALGSKLKEASLTKLGNSQVGTRLGLNIWPGVSGIINRRWEANIELLYSQNGSYANLAQIPTVALDKVMLHYIEVPLSLAYRFNIKKNEKEHFYKRRISGGITYARLFNNKIVAIDGSNLTNDVRFEHNNVYN